MTAHKELLSVPTELSFQIPGEAQRDVGALFPGAHNFTISGGHFTSNFTQPTPSGFRQIPLGDVDLRNEICLDDSGLVHIRKKPSSARRMYSAQIDGKASNMTVVLYQGNGAEEEWKRDFVQCARLRHPNFVQPYATVASCGLYATIFHDELVPFQKYMDEPRSMLSTVHLYSYFEHESSNAVDYCSSVFGEGMSWEVEEQSLLWIRHSTGHLCIEYSPASTSANGGYLRSSVEKILSASQESAMVASLSLEKYHEICWIYLKDSWIQTASPVPIELGAVVFHPGAKDKVKIAHILDTGFKSGLGRLPGFLLDAYAEMTVKVMDNEFNSSVAYHYEQVFELHDKPASNWLAQANHILSLPSLIGNCDDHALVIGVRYRLSCPSPSTIVPEGYLFVYPAELLRTADGTFIHPPEFSAYWSLDSVGNDRLPPTKASELGFPAIEWTRGVHYVSWDDRVYAGLSYFHAAKGFNPTSQDVARHMGKELYQLYDI
ncbi:hypothetical protein B0H13DRAFT_2580529 [Mycena leptocephala]|nr:hypothetical protein B0H13DRAFT_2580529 [Mycena leptocephala]